MIEFLPRVRGAWHRNPGLDAREELARVVAETEVIDPQMHFSMMSSAAGDVKPMPDDSARLPPAGGRTERTSFGNRSVLRQSDRGHAP